MAIYNDYDNLQRRLISPISRQRYDGFTWDTDYGYTWLRLTHLVLELNLPHLMIIIQQLLHIIDIPMLLLVMSIPFSASVHLMSTLFAVNSSESHNPVSTPVSTTVASRHTLYGFEIQTLDSMSTSGNVRNVVLSFGTANIPDHLLSVDTTSTGTIPTSTEHQHLQFIRFETKCILYPFYVNCDSFNDILVCIMFTIVLCCK
ncbi:hypothetical protein Hanom_Chr13g01191771 [Helianthus anomalus]